MRDEWRHQREVGIARNHSHHVTHATLLIVCMLSSLLIRFVVVPSSSSALSLSAVIIPHSFLSSYSSHTSTLSSSLFLSPSLYYFPRSPRQYDIWWCFCCPSALICQFDYAECSCPYLVCASSRSLSVFTEFVSYRHFILFVLLLVTAGCSDSTGGRFIAGWMGGGTQAG